MRVALVTREYPPETEWGGIGRFYTLFAVALRDAGHEVEVFTQGIAADRMEECNGILVHRVVPRQWVIGRRAGGDLGGMGVRLIGVFALSLAAAMAGRVALRHRLKPFDVVEGHEHLGINAFVNAYGKGRFTSVSRYHAAYHSLVHRGLVNWPASRLIRWLERTSIQNADARIASSGYIEEMTRRDFPGTPQCEAIIPLLSGCGDDAEQIPVSQREKLMIFAGRLVPGLKNPELAAEVFANLAEEFPGWRIEFAGSDIAARDGGTAWEQCERILARYPGRYRYHGPLDQDSLHALYRRARIILIPSGFEAFGLVALEAMAAGTVPVVADATALPEVVGSGGVVFRNGCQDDLRKKLREIVQDEPRQIALSNASRTRAREDLSQDRLLADNINVFQDLIQRNSGKRPSTKSFASALFGSRSRR